MGDIVDPAWKVFLDWLMHQTFPRMPSAVPISARLTLKILAFIIDELNTILDFGEPIAMMVP